MNLDNREKSLKWCEVCFSATFSWTSPLSDPKVPYHQISSPGCLKSKWTLELRFNMIENFLMFRFYFSLFMVLLRWVIFKSVWYLRASFWVLLHAMFLYDCKQAAQQLRLRERLLTINKIHIIRWNVDGDNNFHSRRQVLRVKCLWKSWVRQA